MTTPQDWEQQARQGGMRTAYQLTREQKIEKWGEGPWCDEPDEIEWLHVDTGLPCLILRGMEMGNLCGYVGVPPGHPWHGSKSVDEQCQAHGGITFYGLYGELGVTMPREGGRLGKREAVTLPAKPDESYLGYWYVGFDCAHWMDVIPQIMKMRSPGGVLGRSLKLGSDDPFRPVYRHFRYVRQECEDLAVQAMNTIGRLS